MPEKKLVQYPKEKWNVFSVTPPYMHGATLSACLTPLATFSPNMAKRTSSSLEKIFPSNSLAATTAPAALAALDPMPLPGFICFVMINSNPTFFSYCRQHFKQWRTSGIQCRIRRQREIIRGANNDFSFIEQFNMHDIVGLSETKSEYIKPANQVRNSGRRMNGNFFHHCKLGIGCAYHVRKNSRGSYFRSCACSLNNQWLFRITIGIKEHDIIFPI